MLVSRNFLNFVKYKKFQFAVEPYEMFTEVKLQNGNFDPTPTCRFKEICGKYYNYVLETLGLTVITMERSARIRYPKIGVWLSYQTNTRIISCDW